MKKGQLLSQPFVILFSLIVIALILFLGFKWIGDLTSFEKQVETQKFQQDLNKIISNLYAQAPRSSKQLNLMVPNDINGICFVNPTTQISNIQFENIQETLDIYKGTTFNENIFFESKNLVKPIEINHLKPKTNPVCFQTRGSLIAKLENKGAYIEIS